MPVRQADMLVLRGILFSDGLRSCVAVAVEGDQTVGGAVVCRRVRVRVRVHGFGQLFTVFHAPLVEGLIRQITP